MDVPVRKQTLVINIIADAADNFNKTHKNANLLNT